MAYCRWSDCDVYVYEDIYEHWVIHVASRRRAAGKGPELDPSTPESLLESYKTIISWCEQNDEYVDIDLPSAGLSFRYGSPGACAYKLEELRDEGFDVPQYAIDELKKEDEDDTSMGI